MKRVFGALVVCTVATLVALPAVAQNYPPAPGGPQPTAGATDSIVPQGGTTTVFGSNWGGNTGLTLLSTPVGLGTGLVNAGGDFSREVTIPLGTSLGSHTIRVNGPDLDGAPSTVNIPIQVVGAGAPEGGEGLAVTGGNITVGLGILVLLVIVGISTLMIGRRRAKAGT